MHALLADVNSQGQVRMAMGSGVYGGRLMLPTLI